MQGEATQKYKVKRFAEKPELRKFESVSRKERVKKHVLLALAGFFIGGVNGLFGAGGGMLAVPALSIIAGFEERKAHATAILVMLPLCVCSGVIYLASNVVDFAVLIPTAIGVLAGGFVGAKLLKFLPETVLIFAFDFLVLVAGFKLLF